MLMFIPTYGIVLLIRFFAVITKYTVLDEQRREAKEGKSQRKNPRSITRGAKLDYTVLLCVCLIPVHSGFSFSKDFMDPFL